LNSAAGRILQRRYGGKENRWSLYVRFLVAKVLTN
jgi:hypothetical protein